MRLRPNPASRWSNNYNSRPGFAVLIGALITAAGTTNTSIVLAEEQTRNPCTSDECCGMDHMLTPDVVAAFKAAALNGTYEFDLLPTNVQRVGITFHVVRTSEGFGGLQQVQIDRAIEDVNGLFTDAGMEFFQCGEIRYIDDDEFYYNVDTMEEIDALRSIDPDPYSINVYCTPNLQFCGISSFTWSSVQGIVMANTCIGSYSNETSFPHEVGHYFDLLHTHETAMGTECVARTNCETTGDLLCDTPADPDLRNLVNSQCQYIGNLPGPCTNDPPYAPDPSNLMSYSLVDCRTNLTPQQNERMLGVLMNLRPELLDPPCGSGECLQFDVANLVACERAGFTVTNGIEGERVVVMWGTSDGDFVFDNGVWCAVFGFRVKTPPIKQIALLGTFDQDGQFIGEARVPCNLSGLNIRFQAAMQNTCPDACMSNIWTGTIV